MPYNETDAITTRDVLDQIRAKNLDGARDAVKDILYKKSAEKISDKKLEVAKSIGNSDYDSEAEVIDAPDTIEPVDIDQTTVTGEPASN
jgi:hypothetical protein